MVGRRSWFPQRPAGRASDHRAQEGVGAARGRDRGEEDLLGRVEGEADLALAHGRDRVGAVPVAERRPSAGSDHRVRGHVASVRVQKVHAEDVLQRLIADRAEGHAAIPHGRDGVAAVSRAARHPSAAADHRVHGHVESARVPDDGEEVPDAPCRHLDGAVVPRVQGGAENVRDHGDGTEALREAVVREAFGGRQGDADHADRADGHLHQVQGVREVAPPSAVVLAAVPDAARQQATDGLLHAADGVVEGRPIVAETRGAQGGLGLAHPHGEHRGSVVLQALRKTGTDEVDRRRVERLIAIAETLGEVAPASAARALEASCLSHGGGRPRRLAAMALQVGSRR